MPRTRTEFSNLAASVNALWDLPTRAEFLAATIPAVVQRTAFIVGQQSYAVIRDPAGPIEQANGQKWRPDGDLFPEHFGAAGNYVAATDEGDDDTAAFALMKTYVETLGGRKIELRGRNYLVDAGTLDFAVGGVSITGPGHNNVANLVPADTATPTITVKGITGAGIRFRGQGCLAEGFRLTSDPARAAASFDIDAPGVRVEPDDTSTARADRCRVRIRIDNQPGDGILAVGSTIYFAPDDVDIYACKGFGIRGDAGITTGITRTNPHYPGLWRITNSRIGFCGGHAIALSCPDADQQAEMAIRCIVDNVDSFGNGTNTAIMYPAADGKFYDFWIFGENCEVNNSAPCGRSGNPLVNEMRGGVAIGGRDNHLKDNRYIQTTQPVYWLHKAEQPSTGLTVSSAKVTNDTITHNYLVARQSADSDGLRIFFDRYENFARPCDMEDAGAPHDVLAVYRGQIIGVKSLNTAIDTVVMADDTAIRIRLDLASASVTSAGVLTIAATAYASGCGQFHCRVGSGSPATTKVSGHANTDIGPTSGAGALAGTTGTDGNLNVSCDADSIYIENRRGFNVTLNVALDAFPRWASVQSVALVT